MTTINVADEVTYACKKAGKDYAVRVLDYTPEVLASIFTVGMARILGDTHANAKTAEEADAAILKKLDAWARGEVRASRGESSADPVAAEAFRMAIGKVKRSDDFKAWVVAAKCKSTDKPAVEELGKRAKVLATRADIVALAQSIVDLSVDV
jgi:hypothetical protein